MIRKSFIFLEGMGKKREEGIWKQGIASWQEFLGRERIKGISPQRKRRYDSVLRDAQRAVTESRPDFFSVRMPQAESWRLYRQFSDDAVFLDIETSNGYGNVIVVGLYDGSTTKTLVRGFNLYKNNLWEELCRHKLIVTFNGSSFDIPVLEKYFGLRLAESGLAHFDLRHACARAGLTGGLKEIEKKLGISRSDRVQNIVGKNSHELWHLWNATADRHYLDLLVEYNEEDIINLQPIADRVCVMLESRCRANHATADADKSSGLLL